MRCGAGALEWARLRVLGDRGAQAPMRPRRVLIGGLSLGSWLCRCRQNLGVMEAHGPPQVLMRSLVHSFTGGSVKTASSL